MRKNLTIKEIKNTFKYEISVIQIIVCEGCGDTTKKGLSIKTNGGCYCLDCAIETTYEKQMEQGVVYE